ncbi:MAG: iron-sulfur cluster assembly scaffold protein [Candidatus Nanohalobium sp.]
MYKEQILDHNKRPRNTGPLDTDIWAEGENTSCGDKVKVYLEVEDGKIQDMKHETEGCAICTAVTSILSEELPGKKVSEVENLDKDYVLDFVGDISPMRLKCAMLGLLTVQEALEEP